MGILWLRVGFPSRKGEAAPPRTCQWWCQTRRSPWRSTQPEFPSLLAQPPHEHPGSGATHLQAGFTPFRVAQPHSGAKSCSHAQLSAPPARSVGMGKRLEGG